MGVSERRTSPNQFQSSSRPELGAVDLIGDAFALVARRPDTVLPVVGLDAVLVGAAALNSSVLSTTMLHGGATVRLTTGLFAPALLPFTSGTPSWLSGRNANALAAGEQLWQGCVLIISAILGGLLLTRMAMVTSVGDRRQWTSNMPARFLGLAALLVALPLFVASPLVIGAAALERLEGSRWPLVTVAAAGGSLAFLMLRFSFDALVVDQLSPLDAIRRSWRVVSDRPVAAIRLLALGVCITAGMRVLWLSLSDTPVGLTAGIAGNGLVATALALARMNFYRMARADLSAASADVLVATD